MRNNGHFKENPVFDKIGKFCFFGMTPKLITVDKYLQYSLNVHIDKYLYMTQFLKYLDYFFSYLYPDIYNFFSQNQYLITYIDI